jgi:cytochrome c oxidase subunit IV
MTGLHAIHVTVGIGIMLVLALLAWLGKFSHGNHNAVEIAGLYWQFRRYCLGFSISSLVFSGAPIMEKVVEPKVYVWTCIALLALLASTWMIAYVDLGPFNLIVALAVAITKAMVIALFFMHIKGSSRLLHLAAIAGVIWLLFLISLTLGDYSTRGWVPLNH